MHSFLKICLDKSLHVETILFLTCHVTACPDNIQTSALIIARLSGHAQKKFCPVMPHPKARRVPACPVKNSYTSFSCFLGFTIRDLLCVCRFDRTRPCVSLRVGANGRFLDVLSGRRCRDKVTTVPAMLRNRIWCPRNPFSFFVGACHLLSR